MPKKSARGPRVIPVNPSSSASLRVKQEHTSADRHDTESKPDGSDYRSVYVHDVDSNSEVNTEHHKLDDVDKKEASARKSKSHKADGYSSSDGVTADAIFDDSEVEASSPGVKSFLKIKSRKKTRKLSDKVSDADSDSDIGPLTKRQEQARPKANRGTAQLGVMGPTPTSLDEFNEGDKIITRLRLNGKNWKEIETAWNEWAGATSGNSTVRKRWKRLEALMLKGMDSDVDVGCEVLFQSVTNRGRFTISVWVSNNGRRRRTIGIQNIMPKSGRRLPMP